MAERWKGIPGKEAILRNLKSMKDLGTVLEMIPVYRKKQQERWHTT